ncbi:MAG: hypothetical protein GY746_07610, partial [Gammaproteobacteria bacterium]|nr:hypothetical protein [Gammaproteobacteria bacterium]
VECRPFKSNTANIGVGLAGLNQGEYYYISIDPSTTGKAGNFQICVSNQVSYDFAIGAIDVTSLVASNGGTWCSADDAITYSNMDATPDGAESSCKASGHDLNSNVWFKYQVNSSKELNFELKIKDLTDQMKYPYLTVWKDDDPNDGVLNLTEVDCRQYKSKKANIGIGLDGLDENEYYYVSVDPSASGMAGNFQICVSDQVSYDFVAGAVDLTSLVASNGGTWCSADDTITYTNVDATPDGSESSCKASNHILNSNVWFKYQVGASQELNFELKIKDLPDQMKFPYLTVWKDDDPNDSELNLIAVECRPFKSNTANIGVGLAGLNQGEYYYISIDPSTTGKAGNFQICVS